MPSFLMTSGMTRSLSCIARSLPACLFIGHLATAPASAQSPAPFYAGKEIRLVVGFAPGGGADTYARLISQHLGRHIEGRPEVVVQHMLGANSLTAANWIYAVAPKDGTVIGSIHSTVAIEPIYGSERARFDVAKFTWLGSASTDYGVMLTWGPSATKSWRDAQLRETPMGGMGPGAAADVATAMANRFLGTQFKVVSGYRGTNDIVLAMERGEVEGIGSWTWSALAATRPNWIAEKKVNVLMQVSIEPHPELTKQGVPAILDLVASDRDRLAIELGLVFLSVGRPFVAPPEMPPERVATLRAAFAAMLKDAAFLDEAKNRKIEVANPKTGEELDRMFRRLLDTPRPIVDQVVQLQNGTK